MENEIKQAIRIVNYLNNQYNLNLMTIDLSQMSEDVYKILIRKTTEENKSKCRIIYHNLAIKITGFCGKCNGIEMKANNEITN